jgi:WD40 repeat protein
MKQLIGIPILFLFLNGVESKSFHSWKRLHDAITPDSVEVIKLGTRTNFKFKGLAVDHRAGKIYLGSWDKKEIVVVSLLTGKHEILKTKYSGKLNGMGCYYKNGKVYALMNEVDDTPGAKPISVLLVFDSQTGKLIRNYELAGDNGRNHFNHVIVDHNGVAYISNTLKSCINSVDTKDPNGRITVLVEHGDLSWVHGIDLSPDETKLFTTSYKGGIRILDLKANVFLPYRDTTLAGDDGLKYYNGSLYGVGHNAIKKYTLDKTETRIIKAEVFLKDHENFNDPRCLHIGNGFLYCLSNIEFEPVTFQGQQTPSRSTALTDTYVLKLNLR